MSRPLLKAKAIYFLYYAAWAALAPFLPLFYRSLGFPVGQIGILTSISPLMAMIGAPFWGAVADASRQHRRVLIGAMIGAMGAVVCLSQMSVFWLLGLTVAAYAFFNSPVIPLIDNSVLALLGDRRGEYGKQRMWGAVGWGLSAPLAGWLAGRFGQSWPFLVYLVLMVGVILAAARLSISREPRGSGSFWSGVRRLLSDRRWFLFLAVVFVSGAGGAVVSNFLFLYMSDLGASKTMMGLALSVATLSEMPVLFFSSWMLKRWGARGLLVIGMAAYVIRAVGYSFATVPWHALALQLFHGLTFSAVWVAGVSFAGEMAPKGLGATAQGLMSSIVMGLGGIAGALIGGLMFERIGAAAMFRVSALAVFSGLVLFLLAGRLLSARGNVERSTGG
jgi:PPP family 3-phenylpropionic acid transporter